MLECFDDACRAHGVQIRATERISNRVVKKPLLVSLMTLDLNHVYNTVVLGYRPPAVAGGVQGLKLDTVAQWL